MQDEYSDIAALCTKDETIGIRPHTLSIIISVLEQLSYFQMCLKSNLIMSAGIFKHILFLGFINITLMLCFYINFSIFCLYNLQYHSVVIVRYNSSEIWCIADWIRHIALNIAYIYLPHSHISVGIFYTNLSKTCQYLVHTSKANIVVVNYDVQLQTFKFYSKNIDITDLIICSL